MMFCNFIDLVAFFRAFNFYHPCIVVLFVQLEDKSWSFLSKSQTHTAHTCMCLNCGRKGQAANENQQEGRVGVEPVTFRVRNAGIRTEQDFSIILKYVVVLFALFWFFGFFSKKSQRHCGILTYLCLVQIPHVHRNKCIGSTISQACGFGLWEICCFMGKLSAFFSLCARRVFPFMFTFLAC